MQLRGQQAPQSARKIARACAGPAPWPAAKRSAGTGSGVRDGSALSRHRYIRSASFGNEHDRFLLSGRQFGLELCPASAGGKLCPAGASHLRRRDNRGGARWHRRHHRVAAHGAKPGCCAKPGREPGHDLRQGHRPLTSDESGARAIRENSCATAEPAANIHSNAHQISAAAARSHDRLSRSEASENRTPLSRPSSPAALISARLKAQILATERFGGRECRGRG